MIAKQQQITVTEARSRVDEFVQRHLGSPPAHPKLGPIVVLEDRTTEYDNAFKFAINTRKFVESDDLRDSLMNGAIIVPKDGTPVHWAPTLLPVAEYLDRVESGEWWWAAAGAEPIIEVKYYAVITPDRTRENPSGVLRRRTTEGNTVDEVFTRSLAWKPTDYFRRYDLGHNEDDYIEITAAEAAEFVRRIRARSEAPNGAN